MSDSANGLLLEDMREIRYIRQHNFRSAQSYLTPRERDTVRGYRRLEAIQTQTQTVTLREIDITQMDIGAARLRICHESQTYSPRLQIVIQRDIIGRTSIADLASLDGTNQLP